MKTTFTKTELNQIREVARGLGASHPGSAGGLETLILAACDVLEIHALDEELPEASSDLLA